MFAPQNQQPTVIDSMLGTKTEWYSAVDEALRASEVIPGQYEYTTATSYGNVGVIAEDGSTFFDINCDRFEIVSLDNSNITAKHKASIAVPDQSKYKYKEYYVGGKTSADVIGQYRIMSNTDLIQTVNTASYEWFMFYNSVSDSAKENNDCFATLKKIRERNPFVPGTYVDLSAITAEKVVNVEIDFRIPLSFFLLLFNLRYHPNWAGKLTIEIYPTYKNLSVAPVVPESDLLVSPLKELLEGDYKVDLGFYNLNQEMLNGVLTTSGTTSAAKQIFKCNTSTTENCKIRLAKMMLKMDIFNSLQAKYIQIPLMFPIQTVQVKHFTQPLLNGEDQTSSATTIGLHHCDSMFTVFKKDIYSTTCFRNPGVKFQFNIDGKFYPREKYDSLYDSRFINMNFDALNVNNSLLTSVPTDVRTSMQPYTKKQVADSDGAITTKNVWNGKDYSNAFIGIPFADNDDFMGGISTTGTVQIELIADRIGTDAMKAVKYEQPTGIYYEDVLLKIRSIKPEGSPQIQLTNATIEQIIGGGA